MGQKISPTAMRLGLTESHSSKWFAKYGAYRALLEEDEKIRTFLRTHPADQELGSSKIVISRILTRIEITMHVAKPRAIKAFPNLAAELKDKLCSGKQIIIKFSKVRLTDASQILRFISEKLEDYAKTKFILRQLKGKLNKAIYKGLCRGGKIKLSGRLDGVAFSRSAWIIVGEVTTQTLRAAIDYAQGSALTKDGQIGIKVWISQLQRSNCNSN
jgi:small subunit ribosomal protein S3